MNKQQLKYRQILSTHQAYKLATIIILMIVMCCLGSAMVHNGRGVKAIGMSNAFVAVCDDPWAVVYNPAGLVQIIDYQVAAFVVPSQYGLPELRTIAFSLIVPTTISNVGFKVERFGFDLYNETEFGLSLSNYLDPNVSLGITFNYYRLQVANYGYEQSCLVNAGILCKISNDVKLGCNISNITNASIGRKKYNMPQVISLGSCWTPLPGFIISFEVEKDICFPINAKLGLEQMLIDILFLRAGVSNHPDKYSFGFSIKFNSIEIGYAGYNHYDLGWTHQVEIGFVKIN